MRYLVIPVVGVAVLAACSSATSAPTIESARSTRAEACTQIEASLAASQRGDRAGVNEHLAQAQVLADRARGELDAAVAATPSARSQSLVLEQDRFTAVAEQTTVALDPASDTATKVEALGVLTEVCGITLPPPTSGSVTSPLFA